MARKDGTTDWEFGDEVAVGNVAALIGKIREALSKPEDSATVVACVKTALDNFDGATKAEVEKAVDA